MLTNYLASNMTMKIPEKYAMRDTDIIIGKAYLDLLQTLGLDQYTGDAGECEADPAEENELSIIAGNCAIQAINAEMLDIERTRAEDQLQEIINSGYMVDVYVEDPEAEDGGFMTSRLPQIGDIVSVPRSLARRFQEQEACDIRERTDEMREVNSPDTNPFSPLGWAEDLYELRITLYDVIENLQPKTEGKKPYTLECLEWLGPLENREDTGVYAHYSRKAQAMAASHDMTPKDFLVALAKDRKQRFRSYTLAQWEAFTREIYVVHQEKYNKLVNDESWWWCECWQDLTTEDQGPGNIALFDTINEFIFEREEKKKRCFK